jgi:hypothetical protein
LGGMLSAGRGSLFCSLVRIRLIGLIHPWLIHCKYSRIAGRALRSLSRCRQSVRRLQRQGKVARNGEAAGVAAIRAENRVQRGRKFPQKPVPGFCSN